MVYPFFKNAMCFPKVIDLLLFPKSYLDLIMYGIGSVLMFCFGNQFDLLLFPYMPFLKFFN